MCLGHDIRRHREQHREAVSTAQTAEELAHAKYESRQWRISTFWSFWGHSSLRAGGFLLQEACQ